MHVQKLIDKGFFFTSKYMQIAYTNNIVDVIFIKRIGENIISEAVLCDCKGVVIETDIKKIEDIIDEKI